MTISTIRVVDSETTGFQDDAASALVELARCDILLPSRELGPLWSTLVNPCVPIPPTASAVHHITDKDVVGAPVPAGAVALLLDGAAPDQIMAAHNRRFDRHFIPTPDSFRWICTYKCAKRMAPNAPGHSNQTLRYWLGLECDPVLSMPPHRAPADCHVTAHVLRRMLVKVSVQQLLEWSELPVYMPTCEFGNKHKGEPWSQIPTDYLRWMAFEADRIDEDTRENALLQLKDRGF